MNNIGKWLYLIGLLVAGIVGLVGFSAPWLWIILVVIGILAAIFYFDTSDLVGAGVRYLVLAAVYSALDAIPLVGPYLTGFFGGVLTFLGPVLLTALVLHFVRKYFFGKK
jgi:hypothetical protein